MAADAKCDTCDRTKLTTLLVESCKFSAAAPAFNLPPPAFGASVGVTPSRLILPMFSASENQSP